MKKILILIPIFILVLTIFIFLDYRKTGDILWGENFIQSLVFLIVCLLLRYLFSSDKKNKESNS
ncbi:hypothetical protein [Metasolibacillus sp.]|uniref:hypothetical protein n=1 Tax=Metasolibacillus sp. TaxID=2703680 RepID=UPI0025D12EF8|nr:hypothetical protein [Metasolibacillus sp.]MCT6926121.1 hypothetical protein [Metasolibacillus sp.]MCT6942320.1 hypothetical protein [Metasolibacillus sp.]